MFWAFAWADARAVRTYRLDDGVPLPVVTRLNGRRSNGARAKCVVRPSRTDCVTAQTRVPCVICTEIRSAFLSYRRRVAGRFASDPVRERVQRRFRFVDEKKTHAVERSRTYQRRFAVCEHVTSRPGGLHRKPADFATLSGRRTTETGCVFSRRR